MILNASNVENVLKDCLFNEGENTNDAIRVQGVRLDIGFKPEKIELNKTDIKAMLLQLPEEFMKSKGKGYSFLAAINTNEGEQWAQHSDVDNLLVLGLATKLIQYNVPRGFWGIFPDGMPYFTVNDD